MCVLSCVWLFLTPWTVARQAPLSMGFNRQEYWIELPFLPPEDFPNPGIKPMSPAFASGFFTTVPPGKPTLCQFHPTIIITNKISTPTFLRWPLTSGTSSIEKCWSSSSEKAHLEFLVDFLSLYWRCLARKDSRTWELSSASFIKAWKKQEIHSTFLKRANEGPEWT